MKNVYRVGLATTLAAVSALALAQGAAGPAKSAADAKAAVDARLELFKEIKKANEPLAAMQRRQRELDPAVVAASATQLQQLVAKIPAAYLVDTSKFKDIKTEAGDNIWQNQADFKVKADEVVKAATTLAAVAGSGDKGATMKAMADVGKACGACHRAYKVEL